MYTRASTANPYGFRPWSPRLGNYMRAQFPLPTTSMSGLPMPNYATFDRSRWMLTRDTRNAPVPRIYQPPELVIQRRNARLGYINPDNGGYGGDAIVTGGRRPQLVDGSDASALVQVPYIVSPAQPVYQPLAANTAPAPAAIGPTTGPPAGYMAVPNSQGGTTMVPSPLAPAPIVQQNTFQPPAAPAVTPSGAAISTATSATQQASPAPTDFMSQINAFLNGSLIPGIPNLYLALGAGALLVLRERTA